ncbi:MAG: alpha/beta hydrolase, partial [Curtobacterium sp.]
MHSVGVVEAPDVPAPSPTVVVQTAQRALEQVSVPQIGSVGVQIDADAVAHAPGSEFLEDLVSMPTADLRRVAVDPAVVTTVQDDPPTARQVASWWAGLGDDEHQVLETLAPGVVGNLEGVPYAVRDRANRITLTAALVDHATPPAETAMLGQVRRSLESAPGDPRRMLITLDTRGAGRAAIAIGDLESAADVTVVVPGMFFTVTGQMHDFTDTANDLATEQATLAPVAAAGHGHGVAVVAWMGYRTPDLSNILS